MAAILEAAVSAKGAKVYLIGADGNSLMSGSEAIVENHNARQMLDILLQYPKRVGMWFKAENVRVGEQAVKVNNGSTNVAADIENNLRLERRRDIILCFVAAPEQNLIQNEWIGRA